MIFLLSIKNWHYNINDLKHFLAYLLFNLKAIRNQLIGYFCHLQN
jgi:hypothetical protein